MASKIRSVTTIDTKDIASAIKKGHRRAAAIHSFITEIPAYKSAGLRDLDSALLKAKKAGVIRFTKGAGNKGGWEIGEDPAIAKAREAAKKKAEAAAAKKAKAKEAAAAKDKAKAAKDKSKAASLKARAAKSKASKSSPRIPGQTRKRAT